MVVRVVAVCGPWLFPVADMALACPCGTELVDPTLVLNLSICPQCLRTVSLHPSTQPDGTPSPVIVVYAMASETTSLATSDLTALRSLRAKFRTSATSTPDARVVQALQAQRVAPAEP